MKIELPLAICGLSITELVKMQSGGLTSAKPGKTFRKFRKIATASFLEIVKKRATTNQKPKNNDIEIENLFDHFNTLLGQDTDTLFNDIQFPQHENDMELDSPITEHEIRLAVFKQKMTKRVVQMSSGSK